MRYLLVFLAVCLFLIGKAQNNEAVQVVVEYKLTHRMDTTQPDNPFVENYMLLANSQNSWYDIYPLAFRKLGKTDLTGNNPGGIPYAAFSDRNKNTLIRDYGKKKLYIELMFTQSLHVVEDDAPSFNWTLDAETRTIGGIVCQKATSPFKGRNYTAWFASQLPYSTGPWKFGGLPGLILEVYDDKKEVIFAFTAFHSPGQTPVSLAENLGAVKVTAASYKKMKDALDKDPAAMRAVGGNSSGIVAMNVPIGTDTPIQKRGRSMNNPIEKN